MKRKLNLGITAVLGLILVAAVTYAARNNGERITLADQDFKYGTAELTPESHKALKEVLAMLAAEPDSGLRIEGYTDNQGLAEDNLKFSKQRAQAVMDWLVKEGVDASRLKVEGFDGSRPLADNDTPEGRALNRRVEIVKIDSQTPSVFLPVTRWEFEPVLDGVEVLHDFTIQNTGRAPLNIERVKTG